MNSQTVETLYDHIDASTMLLVSELNLTYLEALKMATKNIQTLDIHQDIDTEIELKLYETIKAIDALELTSEDVRRALQLALLKGLKSENLSLQALTPDSIGLFIGYLINTLCETQKGATLGDLTVGMGNLLTATLSLTSDKFSDVFAVDSSDLYLSLAQMMLAMTQYDAHFFLGDSSAPLAIPLLNVIIADLPTEGRPADFATFTYLPYALIHNHLKYLAIDGIAIYLIGNDFFSHSEASDFRTAITEHVNIVMFLQLPLSLFKDETQAKSILVLKRKDDRQTKAKETLVLPLPSFSEPQKLSETLTKIGNWVKMESNM